MSRAGAPKFRARAQRKPRVTGECHYRAWRHADRTGDKIMVGYVRVQVPSGNVYWAGHWWNEDAEGSITQGADIAKNGAVATRYVGEEIDFKDVCREIASTGEITLRVQQLASPKEAARLEAS